MDQVKLYLSILEERKVPEENAKFVINQLKEGIWRLELVPKEISGLKKDNYIFRAIRKGEKPAFRWLGDKDTFCPKAFCELPIGSGPCGHGCINCFLLGTFRGMRDPLIPLIYENSFEKTVKNFLQNDNPSCRTMGLGFDLSDSLLWEGVTSYARRFIPLFANPKSNPDGKKLIMLSKSTNTHYLHDLPTKNVIVTFSLNPEQVADVWEGRYPSGERITLPVKKRLNALLDAQERGFEVRWRVDPILTIKDWENIYYDWFQRAADKGHLPSVITLGTYRQKVKNISIWSKKWKLAKVNLPVNDLEDEKEGTHFHLNQEKRLGIYKTIASMVREIWEGSNRHIPDIALCKETHPVHNEFHKDIPRSGRCNCLE